MSSLEGPNRVLLEMSATAQDFIATMTRVRDEFGRTVALVGERSLFLIPPPPAKPKVHSRYRTRSPRWRAGTRHTKKQARAARAAGRRSALAPPLTWEQAGWQKLGWTTDD